MTALARLRRWQRLRQRDREMRQFAETLIAPVRDRLAGTGADDGTSAGAAPDDPEALFDALVESARQWRGGRRLVVHRVHIPREFRATGMWLERADQDDVIIEQDAEVWHQAQIFGHELWTCGRRTVSPRATGRGGLGSAGGGARARRACPPPALVSTRIPRRRPSCSGSGWARRCVR
ncbi:hypothetical protein LT493_02455 [Streptomyces tricolor]|nr:hypothetical protein [Streptomyces tricolor]